jgi:hypothetical protein
MPRFLRWILALSLAGGLLVGAVVLLPFADWLPGGTVGDVPTQQVVNGTAFNRLFPAAAPGEELVFSQEKRGFSEARLKRSGELVALLAISDTTTAPEARDKFAAATNSLAGWPLVEQGSQASAVLVGGRFQVKVISQGVGLDAQARHELLESFDLKALAAVRPRRIGPSTPAATFPSLRLVR